MTAILIQLIKWITFFQVVCAFYMCTTFSAIEAVLSLILTFLTVGLALFTHELTFLGVSYIIVYVGAIAILFLFVIMITPLKNSSTDLQSNHFPILNIDKYLVIWKFSIVIITFVVIFGPELFFSDYSIVNHWHSSDILVLIDDLPTLSFLSQCLFNSFGIFVLIAGIILLIALVGVCILTVGTYL